MMLDGSWFHTGGRAHEAGRPAAVFIHGAQNDHSVWALQSRYFAHHGFNVVAVDLPGHGRSAGPALSSIGEMAAWLLALLDRAGVGQAVLIGHSMGALVALEAAARAPGRVTHLALLGATYPMKVSDTLLQASLDDEQAAIDMVNIWSHSSIAHKPSCPGPGFSVLGMSRRLMQRIARRGPPHLFHTDFSACNSYAGGEAAAAAIACPVLFVTGARDAMTPARSAKALVASMARARVVSVDCGHQMMAEQPDAVLDALFDFASSST